MLAGLEIKDFAFSNNIVICEPVVILFSIKIKQINMALPVLIFIAMIFQLTLVVFEPFKVFFNFAPTTPGVSKLFSRRARLIM